MKFSKGIRIIAGIILASMAVSFAACGGSKTGTNTEVTMNPNIDPNAIEVPGIGSLARQAAADGMVLLKNEENTLPFKAENTIALFGKGQVDLIKGGTGSGNVTCKEVVQILDGLETKQKEGKISVYSALADKYKKNADYTPTDTDIKTAASKADTAVYIITRNSGEGGDRGSGAGDYALSNAEIDMIESIIDGGFQKIVVILNIGGMMDTTKLLKYDEIKSILLAWQPGMDGGDAVADILVGDVTPSGKLVDTFAKNYRDYPSSANFNDSQDYVEYTEDIFVGYRYFETFNPSYSKVNFEFGFGLSYTTFELSDLNITQDEGDIVVSVKVTNTGSYNGKEVVQVYYSAPQGKLGNPAKELCAFAKTQTLVPGSWQILTMRFAINDMASYDDTGKVQKSAYVMEAGDYNIYVGNSIRNAGEAGIRYTYHVDETIVTEQLTEQLTAKLLDKRLLADGTYEDIYSEEGIATALGSTMIKVEAEDYYSKHRHADVAFSGDGKNSGVMVNASGEGLRYATYAFDVEKAGDYVIKLTYGYTGSTVENVVKFYVNDKSATSFVNTFEKTKSLWTTQETEGVTLSLKEGLNFVKIEFIDGKAILIDSLTVAPVGAESNASMSSMASSEAVGEAVSEQSAASSQSSKSVPFRMLMKDPELMDEFLDQLSVSELIDLLHGRSGPNEDTLSDTGIIGGLTDKGIPSIQTSDGPAGIRLKTVSANAYPIETMLACTWNTDMLYQIGESIAADAKQNKVDVWLAPAVNIHRNPLTGRNFEYYSEDPYLSGMMASAIINGVQDNGIGVMLKHFVANEKETNRVYSDTRVSERALREIYLKPFEIAIDNANPWALMTSYNKVNGTYAAENKELLTNILRNEWGYDGLVSSDWWNTSVAYKELVAGESLKMKTIDSGNAASIMGAYKAGILTREDLEWHAQKVIELIIKCVNN